MEQVRLSPKNRYCKACLIAGRYAPRYDARVRSPKSQHGTSSTEAALPCGMQDWMASRELVVHARSAWPGGGRGDVRAAGQGFGDAGPGLDARSRLALAGGDAAEVVVLATRITATGRPRSLRIVVLFDGGERTNRSRRTGSAVMAEGAPAGWGIGFARRSGPGGCRLLIRLTLPCCRLRNQTDGRLSTSSAMPCSPARPLPVVHRMEHGA